MGRLTRFPVWLGILSFPLVVLLQTTPVTAVAREVLPTEVWQAARRLHLTHPSTWFRVPSANPGFAIPMPLAIDRARTARLQWPVPRSTRVSSGFGHRVHPVLRFKTLHNGIDLVVPIGTPIAASQSGRVDQIGSDRRSGVWMSIDHGDGVRTVYCHLKERSARLGERVQKGQTIALSGNTGASTGPHLHWSIKVGGRAVDPASIPP